jgi:hypothetical protein
MLTPAFREAIVPPLCFLFGFLVMGFALWLFLLAVTPVLPADQPQPWERAVTVTPCGDVGLPTCEGAGHSTVRWERRLMEVGR